jgi:hypothetical protein
MSLSQKHATRNHRPAKSDKNQDRSKNVGLVPRVDCPEIKPGKPLVTRMTFVEDLILEHCFHGPRISAIDIAGIF